MRCLLIDNEIGPGTLYVQKLQQNLDIVFIYKIEYEVNYLHLAVRICGPEIEHPL